MLSCQHQDPGPHPCPLCIPTHLHDTGTLMWMPLPWGQVCHLQVALCNVLLGQ